MNRTYKELIFTNHALERLQQRQVDMSEVWACWRHPQKSYYAATKGAWVYRRNWRHRQIEVVAKQNERKQWVVLSVWSNYVPYRHRPSWIVRLLKWIWKRMH